MYAPVSFAHKTRIELGSIWKTGCNEGESEPILLIQDDKKTIYYEKNLDPRRSIEQPFRARRRVFLACYSVIYLHETWGKQPSPAYTEMALGNLTKRKKRLVTTSKPLFLL